MLFCRRSRCRCHRISSCVEISINRIICTTTPPPPSSNNSNSFLWKFRFLLQISVGYKFFSICTSHISLAGASYRHSVHTRTHTHRYNEWINKNRRQKLCAWFFLPLQLIHHLNGFDLMCIFMASIRFCRWNKTKIQLSLCERKYVHIKSNDVWKIQRSQQETQIDLATNLRGKHIHRTDWCKSQ